MLGGTERALATHSLKEADIGGMAEAAAGLAAINVEKVNEFLPKERARML